LGLEHGEQGCAYDNDVSVHGNASAEECASLQANARYVLHELEEAADLLVYAHLTDVRAAKASVGRADDGELRMNAHRTAEAAAARQRAGDRLPQPPVAESAHVPLVNEHLASSNTVWCSYNEIIVVEADRESKLHAWCGEG